MQATLIARSGDCRHLEQLQDAERHLIVALAAARESIARCEQALSMLAQARSQIATEPTSPLPGSSCHPSFTQNGHNGYQALQRTRPLTARETEVLRLIGAGHSNRRIAETLFLSPRTIERHIANIYLKIDAHSKAEATSYALRHHLA